MSLAILMALVAGALCLGMLSAIVPLGSKSDLDTSEEATFGFEEEFFDVGGPVIDLEPARYLRTLASLLAAAAVTGPGDKR